MLDTKGISGQEYKFEGPKEMESFEPRSGVYFLTHEYDNKAYALDIGESKDVKDRIENHTRKNQWIKNVKGPIKFYAYYTEYGKKDTRIEIEQDLRKKYNPPCGDK